MARGWLVFFDIGPLIVATPSFQQNCDVDQAAQGVAVLAYYDSNGGAIISQAEMSGAAITIYRNRAGVQTTIVSAAGMSESTDGVAYYNYSFPAASWAIGDAIRYLISGAVVTRGGKTFTFPAYSGFGWILT